MKHRPDKFAILLKDVEPHTQREYFSGKSFRLNAATISDELKISLTPRMFDLLRIAATAYFIDRLIKRERNRAGNRWSRFISCSIEVNDATFWNQAAIIRLIKDALQFVSGDTWDLEFKPDVVAKYPSYKHLFDADNLFPVHPTVCLYSGGLDSAAGLARRLGDGIEEPLIPVVVRHRTDIAKRAKHQLKQLSREFHTQLLPVCVVLSMLSPEHFVGREEPSQRARAFLFTSVGGVVAWATSASKLEIYESGIGAINAPLLTGMQGSQATRGAHPAFLRKMTRLLSAVADRQINVILPFMHLTKGEVVSSLNTGRLDDVARSTVSCVSYPLRQEIGKSCGLCPACIFRRVALNASGICEPVGTYQYDVLNLRPGIVPPEKTKYLRAFLNQIDSLSETDQGHLPVNIVNHLRQTEVIERGQSLDDYVNLYQRYRNEWIAFITKAKSNGCTWTNLIDLPSNAA